MNNKEGEQQESVGVNFDEAIKIVEQEINDIKPQINEIKIKLAYLSEHTNASFLEFKQYLGEIDSLLDEENDNVDEQLKQRIIEIFKRVSKKHGEEVARGLFERHKSDESNERRRNVIIDAEYVVGGVLDLYIDRLAELSRLKEMLACNANDWSERAEINEYSKDEAIPDSL